MRYKVRKGKVGDKLGEYLCSVVDTSKCDEDGVIAMCEKKEHAKLLAERLNLDEALKNGQPVKIEFTPMPEVATLRDQFAMAAMIADAIQSAVVSAAYIGQGKIMNGDYPGPETAGKDYYATADALLEARK